MHKREFIGGPLDGHVEQAEPEDEVDELNILGHVYRHRSTEVSVAQVETV